MGGVKQIQVKVTISPEQNAVLEEVAAGLYVGKATLIRQLVDQSMPYFTDMLEIVRNPEEGVVVAVMRRIMMRAKEEAEQMRLPEQWRDE